MFDLRLIIISFTILLKLLIGFPQYFSLKKKINFISQASLTCSLTTKNKLISVQLGSKNLF